MEFLIRIGSLIFIVIICTHGNEGFATKECPHDYLTSQFSRTFRCLKKINIRYIDAFSKTSIHRFETENNEITVSKICPIAKNALKKQLLCVNKLIETCLDEYYLRVSMRALFSYALQTFKPYEEWNCNTSSIAVNKLSVQMQRNVETFRENLAQTITSYQCQNKRYLMSIITFDKQCSYEEKETSLLDGPFACFSNQSQELRMAVALFNNSSQESLPFCKTIEKMLRLCFNATECFSQREMNSIQQITSTSFSMAMEHISKMSRHLGGFSKLLETDLNIQAIRYFHKTRNSYSYGLKKPYPGFLNGITKQQKTTMQMHATIINLGIRNYETGSCKPILNEFSSPSSRQTSPELIKILYLYLNMFVIILILLTP